MFPVLIPVIYIQFCQVLIPDDQQILCVLLLGSLGEVKATCDNCFLISDHDLVMGNGVFTVNVGWDTGIRYKVAEVYLSDLWLLSRMASTFTPRLWALTRAFAIGAEVKE